MFLRLRSWWPVGQWPSIAVLRDRFLALDLETTGLDPRRDVMVSVAVIPFVDGRPDDGYVTLVDPGRSIPAESTAVHGLTDAMVRGAPPVDRVLSELEAILGDHVLVGHNIGFDLAILGRARRARWLPRRTNLALDTLLLAAGLHPEWRTFTLEHVADRLHIDVVGRHTAEGDAQTAGRILLQLLPELEGKNLRSVADLIWFQRQAFQR
jgi:DNA polymerase-3 subunit epsilon